MLLIDGSIGEGGGQILRTSLSLACLTQTPFRMVNIRKGRKNPGILPQHLTCIHALARISGAKTDGGAINSSEITFHPGETTGGDYVFDIGTAGSTTLLLQALIPPLLFATDRPSSVKLRGGTHAPFSPAFDYIREIFIPALRTLGIDIQAAIERYGFYPKGGGAIWAIISPANDVRPLKIGKRGDIKKIMITSGVGNLPLSIAGRQCVSAVNLLKENRAQAECRTISVDAFGKGTFVFLHAKAENSAAGFSSLGAPGKKAEEVGEEVAREFLAYTASGGTIDPYLADQLILFLASARGESSFSTSCITAHLLTNLAITKEFTGVDYEAQGTTGLPGMVSISGRGLFSA